MITKVFQSALAIPAAAVRAADPGHADARTRWKIPRITFDRVTFYDVTDNLMSRNHIRQNLRQIAFYDVQIRPAHTTGVHAQKHLLGSRYWFRNVSERERRLRDFLR